MLSRNVFFSSIIVVKMHSSVRLIMFVLVFYRRVRSLSACHSVKYHLVTRTIDETLLGQGKRTEGIARNPHSTH